MQRLLKALLLLVAFILIGEATFAQQRPILQVSGRLPQGTLRVFTKDTLYQVAGSFVVSGQLIIEPGTTIEFLPNGRLIDSVGGKIIADGNVEAIWDRNTAALPPGTGYCDLGYLSSHLLSGNTKPEITAPGPNWTTYVPRVLFYYANHLDECATNGARRNTPYLRDVISEPIIFRGRPVNQFSREWGHIVVLPGADSAIFRNVHFVNFRKDTFVVQSTQYFTPSTQAGYNPTQVLSGFELNRQIQRLSSGGGGVMTVFSSKTWLLDCQFDSNFARYHGGAVQFLQAPFDATGAFYIPAPGVPVSPTAYPTVNPETYDLYGGSVPTPFGPVTAMTITTPSGPAAQYRQAYDDGRMSINMGRVRRITFRDNRVVVGNVIDDINSFRDDETRPAPILPTGILGSPLINSASIAKNEAYGGAVYVSGRRLITVYFGGGSALRELGLTPDPTDSMIAERNYAVNYQDTTTLFSNNPSPTTYRTNGARGGAFFIGDSSSMVFERARFEDNFTSTPFIRDFNYSDRGRWSQGGGIYMSVSSPELTVRDNIVFRNNQAGQGGGIYVAAVPNGPNDPFLSPNLLGDSVHFVKNKAEYDGGAIYTQRNMRIESRFLTSIDSAAPGFPRVDRRIRLDSNSSGLSGGAITIDNRTNTTNSVARIERVVLANNIVGDSSRVDMSRQIKLFNPVLSPIRQGNNFGVYSVPDGFHMPVQVLSTQILGGGAIFSFNGNTNFYRSVEFDSNTARGGNGGAIAMVTPVRANRYFLAEGDQGYDFTIGAPVAFSAGPEPTDQRQMTRFIHNMATRDSINLATFNPNPRAAGGTLLDPNRNYTGLGGAIYINDRQPPGQNPGTPRVDTVLTHRVRMEQNYAWSGAAVYSDNYELRVTMNKNLIAGNVAVSDVGRNVDTIFSYRTSAAADSTAGAILYGDIQGPLPSFTYHVNGNSIYDNDARFIVRLPDAPNGSVGFGQSGVDTLRGNYWGPTEAPVTTILPSGTLQNTFYVQGNGCTLPLGKSPVGVNTQGPFESANRVGETRYYNYTPIPVGSIPGLDTLLMEGRVYDLFDKGVDIKTADYSSPRLAPIEDFSVGLPQRLRTNASGVYQGKVVRRLTRDPFVAAVDTNYAKLQREFVGNHPIGYPLFLETAANYLGDPNTDNNDPYALNQTVFFVMNVETGEFIRTTMKQISEGSPIFRSRVEFVADSINRDPLQRRTREGRADFSINELYRLTPRYYLQQAGAMPTRPTRLDSMKTAEFLAARYEDSVALSGRRYGGFITPNLEVGGNGFSYTNRPNGVAFADFYAGERYHALPVKTGDRIWVISRTALWNSGDSLVTILNDARFTGLQFSIDTIGNSVMAPVINGQRDSLEKRQPVQLRNTRFLTEDVNYVSDTTGALGSQVFEFTADDPNGFYDPRSLFFPDRYTSLRFEWTPLREFANGSTVESRDPQFVRLAKWLRADTVFPNEIGVTTRPGAPGYLRFYGTPHNPDVVPGGELLQLRVSNYPPGIRTIDSLKALADSIRPSADDIAKYIFLYPPYFNCQVYDPVNARYLQQDTVDVGGASTSTYRLRIFVQDTPPVFLADVNPCGRAGLAVANLTNQLRFDYDVTTDDEGEDKTAETDNWTFPYGRTNYGFIFTDRIYIDAGDSTRATDDVREIRPVWLADSFLLDSTKLADRGAAFGKTGQIKVRIDSARAIAMLRNPAQYNNVYNLDSIFTIVAHDGHMGQNKRDLRVTVNVAPQLQPVPPAAASLPDAKEDFDYNPQLLDSSRRIKAVDLNLNQRVRYYLVYANDGDNDPRFQTGTQVKDSNNNAVANTATQAFVPRDGCYFEAGLFTAPKTTPSWLKINPISGLLYGTPGLNDAPRNASNGGPETVTVVVEDEFGLTDVRTYTLNVDSTNHRPRLFGRPALRCVSVDSLYDDSIQVTDIDLQRLRFTETLTFRVLIPATGFTVTPATQQGGAGVDDTLSLRVSGRIPANTPAGKFRVTLEVRDAGGIADTISYEITISNPVIFSMPLYVHNTNKSTGNNDSASQTLVFGLARVGQVTTGDESSNLGQLDAAYCEYELPPQPPKDVFDARWTIVKTNGILRNIFPETPSPDQGTRVAWKGTFQPGSLDNASANFPIVFTWSKSAAQKAPKDIFFEDQFWDDNTNTGLFRVNMKNGVGVAGTGVQIVNLPGGDLVQVTINLTNVEGFKIVYDLTSGVDTEPVVAGGYTLASNVPNPFSKVTEISYFAPRSGSMKLEVYSVDGQLVKTLVNGNVEAGAHTAVWNANDDKGKAVASGTYVYRLTAGQTVLSQTMVLAK
jgi:predicted outer membrane repeat protein